MNEKILDIKLPTQYTEEDLFRQAKKKAGIHVASVTILKKSLDARKKNSIQWNLRIGINIPQREYKAMADSALDIPFKKREERVIIAGSGPAGIFSALVLARAGFKVTLAEKGKDVEERSRDIDELMENSRFSPMSNFAFGEGGAGTFSDGKLTSRSKHISKEKLFMLSEMIHCGAPEEIYYMTHPHVGSDNLKIMAVRLRKELEDLGGEILFDTEISELKTAGTKVTGVRTSRGDLDCDYVIMAPGHSSLETYKMLIQKGVLFKAKNFALGFRTEHPQALINRAQWGCETLPGVKAAEYRLTAQTETTPVFSFCMCPGGTIVPAQSGEFRSVVNGMSYYKRNGVFANAAIVTGYNYNEALGREVDPLEILERLDTLEKSYYEFSGSYKAPAMTMDDFLKGKASGIVCSSSYSPGLIPADLSKLLPQGTVTPLREGLTQFCKKLKGFDQGNIIGLESKTSSPIQVARNREGLCDGFENLYLSGEGSGWAGGIISSGADGIKAAMDIIHKHA